MTKLNLKSGIVNSMRITTSTFDSLEGLTVEVLGGLVSFRPVPSIGEWVLCLLLLRDSDAGVGDGSKVGVCCFKPVSGLYSGGGEAASSCSFLNEEEVEECNKQYEGGE